MCSEITKKKYDFKMLIMTVYNFTVYDAHCTYTVVGLIINTMKMILDLNFRFLPSFPTVWMDTHKHETKVVN